MARRMVDTDIWKKDWFLDLSIKQKLIVKFLYDNCDCAGIYEISYRTLKNCFNEEIIKSDLEGIKQIKFISDNKIFIEDFIQFQYGISIEQLNPTKSNVHKGICKSLKKNGLLTLNEPLPNPCLRVLDKDKDKDKNKDIDLFINKYRSYFEKEYKRVFKNKPFLSQQDCHKIIELSQQYDEKTITEAIERLKDISFNEINFKPTASWLLKDNNFERVMNGEFIKEPEVDNTDKIFEQLEAQARLEGKI